VNHPERVGRYAVEELLGRGSMGTVYLAHDPVIDRRVALKVLRPDLGGEHGEQARRRFVREARAAGRLSHPNIVTVFDVGEDEEQKLAFIAMDYVEGRTLQAVTASGRRFAFAEAAELVATLARALDYAHRRGVVHRDVKPANVLLSPDGAVKITDFGVARLDTSELTAEGTVLGSPSYMSPEQIRGRPVDGRSSIEGDLRAGETRRLRVTLKPYAEKLKLEWVD
jgi:serine/threonine protein kinase